MTDDRTSGAAHPQPQPQRNALADYVLPKMDLVGPTVDDDIRRAIRRYGAEAVKAAVEEATKAKRGRKREPDWRELKDIIETDARLWLMGKDVFSARTNYSIAKAFAESHPGHSAHSTHKRIERKLSKRPYDRRWFTLVSAEEQSRNGYPYAMHLRALEALSELPADAGAEVWRMALDRALGTVADYEAREGAPPPAEMTFPEVEAAVRKSEANALANPPRRRGLFGSTGSKPGALGGILSNLVTPDEEETD